MVVLVWAVEFETSLR